MAKGGGFRGAGPRRVTGGYQPPRGQAGYQPATKGVPNSPPNSGPKPPRGGSGASPSSSGGKGPKD